MHGSGSCHASPESLTFAFWGEIVPSLPDLNYRVTQGMFQAFMAWGVHFISVSDCYLKKKKKTMNAFAKQCLWGYFNYCYCSSKTVSEVLEMVLNLNCQENSSEFGK